MRVAMKPRRRLAVAGAAVVAVTLAACGGGGDSAGSDGAASGPITIASWAAAADAMEDTAELYMAENPGTEIIVERVGHGYESIIPPLTAGSGAPDVIHVEQRDFQTFLRQFDGQFLNLTDEIADREGEFASIAWEAVTRDGEVFGFPWDLGPAAVWYRTDFYEQAGIDVDAIETWDDFIAAGHQLQDELDDVSMVTFDLTGSDPNPSTWMILMNQLGGRYTNDAGEIDFVNDANVRAMEQVHAFKEEGIALDSGDWSALVQNISSGNTASVILPIWLGGTIKAQAPDQEGVWGAMPLPAFESGGNREANLGGGVLAIHKDTQNAELAIDFLNYALLTEEGQTVQMDYGLFPSWQPFYESDAIQEEDPYFATNIGDFFASVSTDIPTLEFGPYYMDFHSELLNAYGQTLTGAADATAALEQAEDRAATATGLEIADR